MIEKSYQVYSEGRFLVIISWRYFLIKFILSHTNFLTKQYILSVLELKHYYPYIQIRNLYTYNKLQQLGWFTKWTLSIDYVKWLKDTKVCKILTPFYKHIIVLFILYDNFMDRMILSHYLVISKIRKNANF